MRQAKQTEPHTNGTIPPTTNTWKGKNLFALNDILLKYNSWEENGRKLVYDRRYIKLKFTKLKVVIIIVFSKIFSIGQ